MACWVMMVFGIGVFCLFLVLFCLMLERKEIKAKRKKELENVSSIQQVFIKSH